MSNLFHLCLYSVVFYDENYSTLHLIITLHQESKTPGFHLRKRRLS